MKCTRVWVNASAVRQCVGVENASHSRRVSGNPPRSTWAPPRLRVGRQINTVKHLCACVVVCWNQRWRLVCRMFISAELWVSCCRARNLHNSFICVSTDTHTHTRVYKKKEERTHMLHCCCSSSQGLCVYCSHSIFMNWRSNNIEGTHNRLETIKWLFMQTNVIWNSRLSWCVAWSCSTGNKLDIHSVDCFTNVFYLKRSWLNSRTTC